MCYFNNALTCPQASIDAISHALDDQKFGIIDMIVGTGLSGIMLLVPISIKSGIQLGAIRKAGDVNDESDNGGSHSFRNVETDYMHQYLGPKVKRYVIIDDLIETGGTIERIIKIMEQTYPDAQCAGIVLYQDYRIKKHLGYPVSSISNKIASIDRSLKGLSDD